MCWWMMSGSSLMKRTTWLIKHLCQVFYIKLDESNSCTYSDACDLVIRVLKIMLVIG